eukprot:153066-Prorocentrum_minimum.AAC.2
MSPRHLIERRKRNRGGNYFGRTFDSGNNSTLPGISEPVGWFNHPFSRVQKMDLNNNGAAPVHWLPRIAYSSLRIELCERRGHLRGGAALRTFSDRRSHPLDHTGSARRLVLTVASLERQQSQSREAQEAARANRARRRRQKSQSREAEEAAEPIARGETDTYLLTFGMLQ